MKGLVGKGFVVIIEGCDKCGKTSLANRLSSGLGWPVLKFNQPKGDAVSEYVTALLDHPGPFIADRFYLGESVYGPLYRGTSPLRGGAVRALEALLQPRGALLVLMEDDAAAVAARFAEHGEGFACPADVPAILAGFEREWTFSQLSKIRARWCYASVVSVVSELVRYAGGVK